MGAAAGPNIIEDGLVLYLDAANERSYPGSGNEWFDLSGNNFHMSLKNSPTFNTDDKFFELDGSNQYGSCDGSISNSISATVANLDVGGNNEKTVVAVCTIREIGSTAGGLFDLGDHGSTGRHYCLRMNSSYTNFRAQFWSTPDYDFSYDGRNTVTFFNIVYGSDLIGRTFGNDAELLGQDGGAFSLVTAGNKPFEMGRYAGSSYAGIRVQAYFIYNRGLNEVEIKQNYQALRGRHGI